MDFLRDAIQSEVKKRKAIYSAATKSNGSGDETAVQKRKKYVRIRDLEQAEQELSSSSDTSSDKRCSNVPSPGKSDGVGRHRDEDALASDKATDTKLAENDEDEALEAFNVPPEEIVRRLRMRGEPIRLFGETDRQRKIRLRTLEVMDEKSEGQRNDLVKVLEEMESGSMLQDLKKRALLDNEEALEKKHKLEMLSKYDTSVISLDLLNKSPEKVYTLLYVYFKRMMYEWEQYLSSRPDEEKSSMSGKLAAAAQRQSAEYIKPFFRLLKKKSMDMDVLARITEIAQYMQVREYVKANDAYLRLSIGNAPWPIDVLNDETQRKWIQTIKRLMTFAQKKYPPDDLSKLVS
ncbi:hypothetical protein EV182_002426 [Spiromyces aspiralis]|uniref:Uncharacterized protein n=1 Tax=Spiromyces aspiralis TaxID=68401 RepID=A0ACC1HET2_9FUNG|nr:hypothetical protein EV182_002426 [Spiromyces aspiralis]